MNRLHQTSALALLSIAALALSGCKAREMGIGYSSTEAKAVDPSWVTAAKSCWPALGKSTGGVEHVITDPMHFRATFGVYASLTDAQIESVVAQPVSAAPYPDHSSLVGASTPILTLAQAANGDAPPQNATTGIPPEYALCAVQSGKPVGFK